MAVSLHVAVDVLFLSVLSVFCVYLYLFVWVYSMYLCPRVFGAWYTLACCNECVPHFWRLFTTKDATKPRLASQKPQRYHGSRCKKTAHGKNIAPNGEDFSEALP